MQVIIGSVTLTESLALYILITSASALPPQFLLSLSIFAVYMFIVIVGPFKLAANPYQKSVELLGLLKSLNGSKWSKRSVMSFPSSKLSLGDGK